MHGQFEEGYSKSTTLIYAQWKVHNVTQQYVQFICIMIIISKTIFRKECLREPNSFFKPSYFVIVAKQKFTLQICLKKLVSDLKKIF